jgi:hypothetical protein
VLTLHHTDGHGRERFIAVSDVRYVPRGPGDRPAVHFDRCDGSNEATGFAYGRVEVINEGGVTIRHIVLGAEHEDKSLAG